MRNNNGYTLLELLVTVAVATTLATVGLPRMNTFILNNLRAAEVNEFIATMAYARSEALKRGYRVSLCRTADNAAPLPTCGTGNGWEDGWIVFRDENRNNQPDSGADILLVHEALHANTTLRGDTNVATRISYAPSGRTAATFGNLVRCDERGHLQSRVITFPLSGRVRTSPGEADTDCTPLN